MNAITLFTPLSGDHERYASLRKSKKWRLEVCEREAFKKHSGAAELELCYIDLAGASASEVDSLVRSLVRKRVPNVGIGIIDPEGKVADPARLFHRGVIDYIGPALRDGELAPKRLEAVMQYAAETVGRGETSARQQVRVRDDRIAPALSKHAAAPADDSRPVEPEGPETWPHATAPRKIRKVSGWEEIKPSNEYTFWMMFVELDDVDTHKKTASDAQAVGILEAFRSVIERYAEDFNGRLWIWKEGGGVVLFPFDGESPGAVVTSIRLALNRTLINVEDMPTRGTVSYRVALHLGNTVYERKGQTGNIVSDAVNLLFHLGQRYTAPGTLSMTEQAAHFASTALLPYFSDAGVFEGAHIYRMRPHTAVAPAEKSAP